MMLHEVKILEIPTCTDVDGSKEWCLKNGEFHRLDGPAIENADGSKAWYVNGNKISEKEIDELKSDCKTNEDFVTMMKLKYE